MLSGIALSSVIARLVVSCDRVFPIKAHLARESVIRVPTFLPHGRQTPVHIVEDLRVKKRDHRLVLYQKPVADLIDPITPKTQAIPFDSALAHFDNGPVRYEETKKLVGRDRRVLQVDCSPVGCQEPPPPLLDTWEPMSFTAAKSSAMSP